MLVLAAVPAAPARTAAALVPVTSFPAAGELVIPTVRVRATPDENARTVRVLHQFRANFHPEAVLAVGMRDGADGVPWYRISLPGRPNGGRGWVRGDLVELHPVANRIVVHRGSRTLEVRRIEDGALLLRARIAIGRPSAKTPLGHDFYVRFRFIPSNSFLGIFAFETSAYAPLSDWPGDGVVGIHGTSAPSSIGHAVSHGCIRLFNRDVAKLKYLAPVGTPIDVVP